MIQFAEEFIASLAAEPAAPAPELHEGVLSSLQDHPQGCSPLLSLPQTCATMLWDQLEPSAKKKLFLCSKATSQRFAHCVRRLQLKVQPDHTGCARAPRLLHAEARSDQLQGISLVLIRKQFQPNTFLVTPSGEATPTAMRSVEALLRPQSYSSTQDATPNGKANDTQDGTEAHSNKFMQAVVHVEMLGFNFQGASVFSCLAESCSQLCSLTLRNMDITGPFLTPVTIGCPSLSELTLARIKLDSAAVQSLDSLSNLTALTTLTLERLVGLSKAGCTPGVIPGLAAVSGLRRLELQVDVDCTVAPHMLQLVQQISHLSSLTSLRVWELKGVQDLDAVCAQFLARYNPMLARLEFDRHVMITGVRDLLDLQGLTSICTRSLEPKAQPLEEMVEAADGSSPVPGSLVGSRCSWLHLSLGAFCPSLTALAALPLHSLTHPFYVNELDLAEHPSTSIGDMDTLAEAVLNALLNCVNHCPTLDFTAGKIEINGGGLTRPLLANACPALLALEPLRACREKLHHVKLVGLSVREEEMRALGEALGEQLEQVTLSICSITPEALSIVCDGITFRGLRQLSFGRRCTCPLGVVGIVQAVPHRHRDVDPLRVRLTKPVGVQLPKSCDLLASEADVNKMQHQLNDLDALDRVILECCNSIV